MNEKMTLFQGKFPLIVLTPPDSLLITVADVKQHIRFHPVMFQQGAPRDTDTDGRYATWVFFIIIHLIYDQNYTVAK